MVALVAGGGNLTKNDSSGFHWRRGEQLDRYSLK